MKVSRTLRREARKARRLEYRKQAQTVARSMRKQLSIGSIARIAGHRAVARMFKLPHARGWGDEPLWWLDPTEERR